MKIRLISDIHLEFGDMTLPIDRDEKNTVLVLAGDIGIASKPHTFLPFLVEMSTRFQDIIYIMGNHEHYQGSMLRSLDKIKDAISDFGGVENIHVVNNEVVRISDVSFVCSTLWASYNNGDPIVLHDANLSMNDHRLIRTGNVQDPYGKKFLSMNAYIEFHTAKDFIFKALNEEKGTGQKTVLVTHHAPSLQSIAAQYRTGAHARLNGAYASDLDELIIDASPVLAIHGHTHLSFDYMIENTRVVCNPFGYRNHEENPNFDPSFTVEI